MRARVVRPKDGKPKPPALLTTAFRSFVVYYFSIRKVNYAKGNVNGSALLDLIFQGGDM